MQEIEERFVAWATSCPDIRAACVIGSRARVDHPADAWSDLDIVVITSAPERYLTATDWLAHMGVPWLTFVEPTAVGAGSERRVLFEGGHDVDFAVFAPELFERIPPDIVHAVVRRGMRVLLDKDGHLTHLLASVAATHAPSARPPTDQECLEAINDFWYHAVWTAKKLRRGELLTAKGCCDGYLKDLLLRMTIWHAGATRGWTHDTWHRGRFFEEWADPRVVAGFHAAYAHYDAADIERALWATMDLFRWVARETIAHLGYPYPGGAEERVVALVTTVLSTLERSDGTAQDTSHGPSGVPGS
jgi:aminoglycoside 6-adenylyltransferase